MKDAKTCRWLLGETCRYGCLWACLLPSPCSLVMSHWKFVKWVKLSWLSWLSHYITVQQCWKLRCEHRTAQNSIPLKSCMKNKWLGGCRSRGCLGCEAHQWDMLIQAQVSPHRKCFTVKSQWSHSEIRQGTEVFWSWHWQWMPEQLWAFKALDKTPPCHSDRHSVKGFHAFQT